MFRRKRFGELITMQLDVFAIDHADRLQSLRDTLEQYRASERYAAEERYGDYADEIDWAAEELAEMRDAYAATIDPDLVDQYEREFSKAVHRVYPPIAVILDTL
ncbi:MAG: hypothetical protein WCN97_01985 [Thermoleophilia bacterium]